MKSKVLTKGVRTVFALLLLFVLQVNRTQGQIISTIAGTGTAGYSGDSGLAVNAKIAIGGGTCVDKAGNIYIPCALRIRKITIATGIITTIAGNGSQYYNGDGISAISAGIAPMGVCLDDSGNVYIADMTNNRIRKITIATGIITTVAGTGVQGISGDGGLATKARLKLPEGVFVDHSGNIYISDTYNQRIRKISKTTGIISLVVGVNFPHEISVDDSDNVYFSETYDYKIKKFKPSTGKITTIAGNGYQGYSGDGGLAVNAELNQQMSTLCLDDSGNVYFVDYLRIRKITIATGIITTVAGNGNAGFSGDSGLATVAKLNNPIGVFVDYSRNIYISDHDNYRIRKVTDTTSHTGSGGGGGICICNCYHLQPLPSVSAYPSYIESTDSTLTVYSPIYMASNTDTAYGRMKYQKVGDTTMLYTSWKMNTPCSYLTPVVISSLDKNSVYNVWFEAENAGGQNSTNKAVYNRKNRTYLMDVLISF